MEENSYANIAITSMRLVFPIYLIGYLLLVFVAKNIATSAAKPGVDPKTFQGLKEYNFTILTGGMIEKVTDGVFAINQPMFDTSIYQFATNRDYARQTGVINYVAFGSATMGIWSDSLETKIKRNTAHAEKNPYSLLLIKDKSFLNRDSDGLGFIGFSHTIPVNQHIWEKYLNGEIQDNSYPSRYIVSDKIKNNEKAFGIIIFSIATYFDPNMKKNKHLDAKPNFERLSLVIKGLAYQILKLIETTFENSKDEIPILIQVEKTYFGKLFRSNNLKLYDKKSADGCDVYIGYISTKSSTLRWNLNIPQ